MISYLYSIKNAYFNHLRRYFEQVLHPAESAKNTNVKSKKAESKNTSPPVTTPESINLRDDHLNKSNPIRQSPAP